MIKTYAIHGIVAGSYLLKAGKGTVRVNFDGGVLDERRKRPATLVTKNPIVMVVIENSEMFKNGTIVLLTQSGDEEPRHVASVAGGEKITAPEKEKKKTNSANKITKDGRKVYEDVTTLGEAVNRLSDLGAKAAFLQDGPSVLETASNMGVSFPNLKLK